MKLPAVAIAPEEAAVLRAMLLGDRSFLDRSESVNFQKTGVFHVLVVAGLYKEAVATYLCRADSSRSTW
jgi:competence protein ComEC